MLKVFLSLAARVLLQAASWKSAANFLHLCMKLRSETEASQKPYLHSYLSYRFRLLDLSEKSQTAQIKGLELIPSCCSGCFEFLF